MGKYFLSFDRDTFFLIDGEIFTSLEKNEHS